MTSRLSTRRRWVAFGTLVVLALIVSGALIAQRWRERGPGEASVTAAVDRFRSSSTTTGDIRVLAPEPGVYAYRGEGNEHLSFMSTSQAQGPTMPATVVVGDDGCWTFEIEYNTFHRQSWEWCDDGGELLEQGGTTHQQFDFVAFKVDETSRLVCDPPFVAFDARAGVGERVTTHCDGRSETTDTTMSSDGAMRFAGREDVTVAGRSVAALHYVADRTLTGEQSGSEHVEMWFAERNGLPLRNEREIRVVSPAPAPLNSVTYEERGLWQITTLEPET